MSTMKEMAAEYRDSAVKIQAYLERCGSQMPEDVRLSYRQTVRELRDTARALYTYYDVPHQCADPASNTHTIQTYNATVAALRSRRAELNARKKTETDNMALFLLQEEILDINARLRKMGATGKKPKKEGLCEKRKPKNDRRF